MDVKIYIGEYKVDLFKDESIRVISNVLDIEDITKNIGDYSQSFTVPASANNNILFKHYYDANILNTFDARVKVAGRIELSGMPFKKGNWALQKVNLKGKRPSSYSINFSGNTGGLKTILSDKLLSDLDLTAFDHEYNSTNVKTGLQSSLFSGNIIYNLLAKKQLYYNSDPLDITQTATLSNIAANGDGTHGIKYTELRPSIKLSAIMDAIETDFGIVFSDDFFGLPEFQNLYMWLDSGTIGGGILQVDWTGGGSTYINITTNTGTYNTTEPALPSTTPYTYFKLSWDVQPLTAYNKIPFTMKIYRDGILWVSKKIKPVDGVTTIGRIDTILASEEGNSDTYNLTWEVESEDTLEFSSAVRQEKYSDTGNSIESTYANGTNLITSVGEVNKSIPIIKIIDFLRGLFQMFKLVVVPNDDGSFYVDTLDNYYSSGNIYDITKYIDFAKHEVSRGNLLNEINYKFQAPTTILNEQFLDLNGKAYGDEVAALTDDSGTPLDGSALSIDLPFEQFVYERLADLDDGIDTEIMYAAIVDDKLAAVNPKPHIFYNLVRTVGTKTFNFLKENDVNSIYSGNINTVSHIDTATVQQHSTTFSQEFEEYSKELITNTLYSNYHKTYIEGIFNKKRRKFVFEAQRLPLKLMLDIKLNDVLVIDGNHFYIDNISTELNTGKVKFNLINSFDYR